MLLMGVFKDTKSLSAVSRFISRRVRVTDEAGSHQRVSIAVSHGPAKPAFCQYQQGKLVA